MSQKRLVAIVLNTILSALGIVLSFVLIIQHGTTPPADQVPFWALALGLVLGILGLVGSWGLWHYLRWAFALTIVVRAIDGLTALPGLFFADSAWLLFWAAVSVIGALAVIVLLPGTKQAQRD